jgi:hypothetical protein
MDANEEIRDIDASTFQKLGRVLSPLQDATSPLTLKLEAQHKVTGAGGIRLLLECKRYRR